MTKVLLTGFPGFLGSELVRRILARKAKPSVVCLVQPKFVSLAKKRLAEIEAELAPPRPRAERRQGRKGCQGRPRRPPAARHRRHHAEGSRPREPGDARPRSERDLPSRGGLRPLGQARERDEDQRPRHQERPRLRRALREAPPPAVRLDLLRLGALRRHLPRGRPGARPGVQQLLRRDQVPRRGRSPRAHGGRDAGLDLPPGGRHRRQPERRDAEVRRPLLRHPLAAEAADGRRPAGARRPEADAHQPRAARLRHRRHRGALGVEGRRRPVLPARRPRSADDRRGDHA